VLGDLFGWRNVFFLLGGLFAFAAAALVIAVGTLIAERPPHRTERAQFGHSAPTSGV
jgi:predicted MFS family arabinose efflux permease